MIGFILLIVPLALIITHGLLSDFSFWHWIIIVVFGGALIVPVLTAPGARDQEQERMEAMNEYADAVRRVQDAAAAMRGCDNPERRARLERAETEAEEAKNRLMERGGWLSQ